MNKTKLIDYLSLILAIVAIIVLTFSWIVNFLFTNAFTTNGTFVGDLGYQIQASVSQALFYVLVSSIIHGIAIIPISLIIIFAEVSNYYKKIPINKTILICSVIILSICILHLILNAIIYPILVTITQMNPNIIEPIVDALELPILINNIINLLIFAIMIPSAIIIMIVRIKSVENENDNL